jgi:probable addiction module antidote protein
MTIRTRPFDAANYLNSVEDQADLLNDAVADGDMRYIAAALGAVARARGGLTKLASETGLSRQALDKALSERGRPSFDTVLKVLAALDLQLHVEAKVPELA